MKTPFSILAWKIPWTEEPGMLQSMGVQRLHTHTHIEGGGKIQDCLPCTA